MSAPEGGVARAPEEGLLDVLPRLLIQGVLKVYRMEVPFWRCIIYRAGGG